MCGRLMKRAQMHHVFRLLPSSKPTTNTSPGCYSVQTSSKIRARSSHVLAVCGVVLTLILRYLATCSADTTVKIWSVSPSFEFRLDKALQGHQRWVWDCAFSADSAYLVTGMWHSQLTTVLARIPSFQLLPITQHACGRWLLVRPSVNITGITKVSISSRPGLSESF